MEIGLITAPETDLGREVRAAVAKALKRFEGHDIAAIKVTDLIKIDRFINPEPDTFRVPVERDTPAYTALRLAGIDNIKAKDEQIAERMS